MSLGTDLGQALRALFGAEGLLTGGATEAYRIGRNRPEAALRPADEAALSRVLAIAWAGGLAVVPWGGGSHQSIGNPPERYDLALDLTRLDRLVAHDPGDLTATAQAGIRLADLARRLAEHGQFLPLDVPLPERATLGGALATRLSGPLRCRYGTARDLVLGLRVAHADGTISKAGARVVKNATGYDVTKLYLGSHGTLGIILEATFRLYPRPEVERGWWLRAPDLATVQALANRVLGSHLVPSRVELMEGGAAQACGLGGNGLLVCVSGLPEAVAGQRADLERMAGACGLRLAEIPDGPPVWKAVSDFPWGGAGMAHAGLEALWRGGVLPADCAKAVQAIQAALPQRVQAAVAATVSHGALRGAFRAETAGALVQGLNAAREALVGLGGYLVVQRLPDAARNGLDVWGRPPDGLGVMRRLKAAFDPKGILNPGRFVGGL